MSFSPGAGLTEALTEYQIFLKPRESSAHKFTPLKAAEGTEVGI